MEEEQQETTFCSNCKKDIPAKNYVMHAPHCQRNIILCELCEEPVPKSQKDEHFDEYHAKVKCECGESMEKKQLEEHKEKDCKRRKTACEYCELECTVGEIDSHKEYCGSRTELCEKCNKRIQHRDLEEHLQRDCLLDKPVVNNNATTSSTSENGFARTLPEEMLQNFGIGGDVGLTAATLHHLFTTGFGTLPVGEIFKEDEVLDNRNVFPFNMVPRENVIARGPSSSNTSQREPRRERNHFVSNQVVDDDLRPRVHLENDELVAALLACDDGSQSDFTSDTYGGLKEPLPGIYHSPNYHNMHLKDDDADLDETILPCEFCGEPIKAQDLIQHQTGCQLTSTSSQNLYPQLRSQPRSLPPLGPDLHFDHNNEEDNEDTEHDDTFLPCEFCQELFPSESLIGHQSICDPDRSRPSSVIHPFRGAFFESEPQAPNNFQPRTNSRPPRPSRPVVVNDSSDEQSMNLFNPSSDLRLSRGISSNGIVRSGERNTNSFVLETYMRSSRGTSSQGSGDNRHYSELASNESRTQTRRNNDVDSRTPRSASSSVHLTVRNKHEPQNTTKFQGRKKTTSIPSQRQTNVFRPLRVSGDDRNDKYEVAIPKSSSRHGEGYQGLQETRKNSFKSNSEPSAFSANGWCRNETRREREGDDEPHWEMRPLQETGTTASHSANERPPRRGGVSTGRHPFQQTQKTRKQMQRLAPSFDKPPLNSDTSRREGSRHQTQAKKALPSTRDEERNPERNPERRAQGTSATKKISKKKIV